MALADTVKKAVKKAFAATGDLPKSVTYTRVVPGTYDADTNVRTSVNTDYTIEVLLVNLAEAEVDYFPANRNTQKMLIAGIDITFIPGGNDYVTIDAVRWEVKRVRRVPGDSLFVVFIQEP